MFEDKSSSVTIILSDVYIYSRYCKSTSLNIVSSLQCRCQKWGPVVNNQSRRRQIADECFIAASRRITPPVICYTSNDCQPSTYKTSSTSNKHITVPSTTTTHPESRNSLPFIVVQRLGYIFSRPKLREPSFWFNTQFFWDGHTARSENALCVYAARSRPVIG